MKKQLTLLFSIYTTFAFAQQVENIGFESGNTTNWICSSGTFGEKNPPKCSSQLPVSLAPGNCQNQGGLDGTATPTDLSQNRHTIMSKKSTMDPNSKDMVSMVAPANLFPSGVNNYSFRIGNAVGGDANNPDGLAYAESIKYAYTVSKSTAGLTYMYAAFLKEQIPDVHPINMAPRFEIKLTDGAGNLIPCGYYQVIAGQSLGFKDGASDNTGIWKYTDWTTVGLDLSAYIGQSVTIEFRTNDCFPSIPLITTNNGKVDTVCSTWSPGGHSAYAYIDLYCSPVEITSTPICANQVNIQLCGPPGYASYEWPANQPGIVPPLDKQCVTVNLPKAGNKYTVNMKSKSTGCPSSTSIILKGYDFTVKDMSVCLGDAPIKLQATPMVTGNYNFKWEPSAYLSNPNVPDPTFTPGKTTTYTVTMIDQILGNCNQVKLCKVTVPEALVTEASDITIKQGETAQLNGKIIGNGTATWEGGQGTFTPDRSTLNATYKPTSSEENTGYVNLTLKGIDPNGICPSLDATMKITILPPVGILTFNQNNLSIDVYPNPFNSALNINTSGLNSTSTELKLFDYTGKEVRSISLKNGIQKIERGNLASGVYFMEITDKGSVLQKKKIVIND